MNKLEQIALSIATLIAIVVWLALVYVFTMIVITLPAPLFVKAIVAVVLTLCAMLVFMGIVIVVVEVCDYE